MQGAQRLALPAGLVLGQREQRPAPLPQGLLRHPGLRLRQDLGVPAGPQRGVQAALLDLQAQLGQPFGLDPPRLPPVQFHQWLPAPQSERFAEGSLGAVRVAQLEQLAAALQELLEPVGIHVVGGQGEPVPVAGRLDRRCPQQPPQPQDAPRHHLAPGGGQVLAPERVGQPFGAHQLAGTDRQRRQHHAIARGEHRAVSVDCQRTQKGNLGNAHGSSVRSEAKNGQSG